MPPPIPSQQGSRAGLITALIVFIILFVVMSVLFFSTNGKLTKAEDTTKQIEAKFKGIVTEGNLADAELSEAKRQAQDGVAGSAFDVVRLQRDDVTKVITGQVVAAQDAKRMAEGAFKAANLTLEKSPTKPAPLSAGQPLTAAITELANQYLKVSLEREQLRTQLETAAKNLTDAQKANQTALQEKDALIAMAKDETMKEAAKIAGLQAGYAAALEANSKATSDQIKALSDTVAQLQTALSSKDLEAGKLNAQIRNLIGVVKRFRFDAKENITRQVDGSINRVPGNGTCFISIGEGDHLPVGMTFQVYDRSKGVPPVGDGLAGDDSARPSRAVPAAAAGAGGGSKLGPTGVTAGGGAGSPTASLDVELPRGKGSIEVISIGPGHTAQCRIIHVEPGQIINEGDVIANLIYNPRVKLNFFIYGDFDLNGNGLPKVQDTAVIRRMIEQWGGRVIAIDPTKPALESLPVEADFIIMGIEPKVTPLSAEDAAVPALADINAKQVAARNAYLAVIGRANDLGVPILNQTRFLYYTGYYDQKTR